MEIAQAFVTVRAKTDQVTSDIKKGIDSATSGMKPIEPKADTKAAGKQIADGLGAAGVEGGKKAGEGLHRGLLSSAQSTVATLTGLFAGLKFAQALGGAVEKASDLNEAMSLSKQIFGETSVELSKLGDASAQNLGISKRAFLEATSQLGNLLMNMGFTNDKSKELSVSLVQLASDMGSAFNREPAEALAAIQSGLIGETEPLRSFGVILNEAAIKQEALNLGLYDGKGALDTNAKAQATLSLIMQNTSAIQGDFARTSEGLANTQRRTAAEQENAAASMGNNFLPIYQRAVSLVGTLANVFGTLPPQIQIGVVALAGMVALAGPFRAMIDVVKTLGGAIGGTFSALANMNPAILLLTAAVAAGTAVFLSFSGAHREAQAEIKRFIDALKAESDGVKNTIEDLVANEFATKHWQGILDETGVSLRDVVHAIRGEAAPSFDELRDKVEGAINTYGNNQLALQAIEREYGISGDAARELVDRVEELGGRYDAAAEDIKRHEKAQADARGEAERSNGVISGLITSVSALGDTTGDATQAAYDGADGWGTYGTSLDSMSGQVGETRDAINELIDAMLSLFDSTFAQHDAQRKFAESLEKVNEATLKAIDAGPQNVQAQRDLAAATDDAVEAALKQAEANVRVAREQAIATTGTDKNVDSQKILVDTLNSLAGTATGPVADAIRGMAFQLSGLGEQHPEPTVDVNADPAKKEVDAANRALDIYAERHPYAVADLNNEPSLAETKEATKALDTYGAKHPYAVADANNEPALNKIGSASSAADTYGAKHPTATVDAKNNATPIFQEVSRQADDLGNKHVNVTVGANISSFLGSVSAAASRLATLQTTGRASGGPVYAGRNYIVGEEGPELLRITSGGGEVINARETQSILRSGSEGRGGVVIGSITVGERRDLRAMSDELDRHLWLSRNGGH